MPKEQAPARETEAQETAQADPSGYVWDSRGYYWHPVARHWYEPYSRVYYSEDGQVLPADRAQAELAQAMGWSAPAAEVEVSAEESTAKDAELPVEVGEESAAAPDSSAPAAAAAELAETAPVSSAPAAAAEHLETPTPQDEPTAAPPAGVEASAAPEPEPAADLELPDLGGMPPSPDDAGEMSDAFLDGPTMVGGMAYEEQALRQSLAEEAEDEESGPAEIAIDFGPEFSAVEHPLDLGAAQAADEMAAPEASAPATEAAEPPIDFAPEPSAVGEALDFSGLTEAGSELDLGSDAEPTSIEPIEFAPEAPAAEPPAAEPPVARAPALDLPDLGAPVDFGAEFSAVGEPIELGAPEPPAAEPPAAEAPALDLPDPGAPVDFGADFSAVGEPIELGAPEPPVAEPPAAEPPAAEPPAAEPPAAEPPAAEAPAAEAPAAELEPPPAAPRAPATPPPLPPAPPAIPKPESTLLAPVPRGSTPAEPPPSAPSEPPRPATNEPPPPSFSDRQAIFGAPSGAASAKAAPEARLSEPERAIVHLVDGQVRRGVLQPGDLFEGLKLQTPEGTQSFEPKQVAIVFLLRKPGEPPSHAEGRLVQVFLPRGRSLTGYAGEEAKAERGFFLRPRTAEGSTSRVFLYPWAIHRMEPSG